MSRENNTVEYETLRNRLVSGWLCHASVPERKHDSAKQKERWAVHAPRESIVLRTGDTTKAQDFRADIQDDEKGQTRRL